MGTGGPQGLGLALQSSGAHGQEVEQDLGLLTQDVGFAGILVDVGFSVELRVLIGFWA